MAPPEHRVVDYVFFGYYLLQIPSTLFFDTQGVYPRWLYPNFMTAVKDHYIESYRDPFLANAWKHPWYLSVCLVEHFIEVPFFFWASICYYYGALKRPQIIIPSIIYCSHTITAVSAVWAMALGADFTQMDDLAPRTSGERLKLCSAYAIFFFIPLLNLIDSVRLSWKIKTD